MNSEIKFIAQKNADNTFDAISTDNKYWVSGARTKEILFTEARALARKHHPYSSIKMDFPGGQQ
jgi:hypothetical protein